MAKINLSAVTSNENTGGPIRLPRDNYKVRCVEEPEFKLSKAQKPMLVFNFELVEPALVKCDGVERDVQGLKFGPVFCSLQENALFKLVEIHRGLGLPLDDLEQDETGRPIGVTYTGREGFALCKSTKREQTKEGSNEPLVNPNTGEPLVSFQHEIERFHPVQNS